MNIIEAVRELLGSFPKIAEVANALRVDFTNPPPDSYALSSTGDALTSRDILGNQTRAHTFVLYSRWQSASDFDRLNNSGVLLELAQYLEKTGSGVRVTANIDGKEYSGITTGIQCSNGMMFAVPETLSGGVIYQLQITATYKIIMEG